MKRIMSFFGALCALAVVLALGACTVGLAPGAEPTPTPAEYRKITAEEAKAMMDESDEYILLDVRTADEFSAQHIPGAVLLPVDEIAARAEAELPDKAALILVYCRSGVRSANAARELVSMGYLNVFDFGGIVDWPFEIVSS